MRTVPTARLYYQDQYIISVIDACIAISHIQGMSIAPAIARQVAMAAPQGGAVKVARVLMEPISAREAIGTPSQGRLINRWWASSGPFEIAVAGNTENRPAPRRTYKPLRLNPRAITTRSSGLEANPIAGGSSVVRTQASPKTLPEIPEMPIIPGPPSLVLDGCVRFVALRPTGSAGIAEMPLSWMRRQLGDRFSIEGLAKSAGSAETSKNLDKKGIGRRSNFPAKTCPNLPKPLPELSPQSHGAALVHAPS